MESFFNIVGLLRERFHEAPGFNLFSVLRSESDEVRLHSRFLAELLNPRGQHGKKDQFLRAFLKELEIDDFDLGMVSVHCEHANIDILIRNTAGQAILVENKIYAGDQPGQLSRYRSRLRQEGYQAIHLVYLTLDSSEPCEASRLEVPLDEIQLIGYDGVILPWLERCTELAVQDPALRESLLQYVNLIQRLTHQDQGATYLDRLKKLLLENNNILNFQDLQHAYSETLVDLQLDLWEKMLAYQQATYSDMGQPLQEWRYDRKKVVRYHGGRGGASYGLFFEFKQFPGGVGVEIDHKIFHGVYCDKSEAPVTYNKLREILVSDSPAFTSAWWPVYRFPVNNLNYKALPREDLECLISAEFRSQLAKSLIDDIHVLWRHVMANAAKLVI